MISAIIDTWCLWFKLAWSSICLFRCLCVTSNLSILFQGCRFILKPFRVSVQRRFIHSFFCLYYRRNIVQYVLFFDPFYYGELLRIYIYIYIYIYTYIYILSCTKILFVESQLLYIYICVRVCACVCIKETQLDFDYRHPSPVLMWHMCALGDVKINQFSSRTGLPDSQHPTLRLKE